MNTGKQINAMVLVVLLLAIATGAYAMWDNSRADTAKDEQLAKTSERAATTFALNCRLCHGDRGEGGLVDGGDDGGGDHAADVALASAGDEEGGGAKEPRGQQQARGVDADPDGAEGE